MSKTASQLADDEPDDAGWHAMASPVVTPADRVAPFAPAGPLDVAARAISGKLQEALGQPVVVENIAGAGGGVGMLRLSQSPGDGYTWLWTTDTTMTVNPHVYPKLGFKPEDLVPVMRASAFRRFLITS